MIGTSHVVGPGGPRNRGSGHPARVSDTWPEDCQVQFTCALLLTKLTRVLNIILLSPISSCISLVCQSTLRETFTPAATKRTLVLNCRNTVALFPKGYHPCFRGIVSPICAGFWHHSGGDALGYQKCKSSAIVCVLLLLFTRPVALHTLNRLQKKKKKVQAQRQHSVWCLAGSQQTMWRKSIASYDPETTSAVNAAAMTQVCFVIVLQRAFGTFAGYHCGWVRYSCARQVSSRARSFPCAEDGLLFACTRSVV